MTEKSIDYDNNLRSGANMGGREGLLGIHVVPLPSPVPPSPLEPSAVQGVGSPSGGGEFTEGGTYPHVNKRGILGIQDSRHSGVLAGTFLKINGILH